MVMSDLKEYVLVTGASSGMGREIALSLSKNYNVILNGRDKGRLDESYSKCSSGKHLIWNYDLSQIDGLEESLHGLLNYNVILNGRDKGRLDESYSKCSSGKHLIWNYDLSQIDGLEESLHGLLNFNHISVSYFVHCSGFMKMYR